MFKKFITLFCVAICASMLASPLYAANERFTLDSSHTTVAFLVDHVGFAKTLGYFSKVSGSFNYDSDAATVSDVKITVETNSVQSDNKARDKHLRNKDFLNVKKYPEMVFTADKAILGDNGVAEIAGQLQLLGQSQPLTLTATLNKAENYPFAHKKLTLGVSARGSLDRSDYGMDYGVANGLVGDTIDLIIEIEANKSK
jgi:polyisoprenoid-binding protein YceI